MRDLQWGPWAGGVINSHKERELLQSGRLVVEVSEASDEIWGPPKA